MNKPAPSNHDIHPLLGDRWSPRAFDGSKSVSDETLLSLFEAARWAPSAFNLQPWRFIVAKKEDSEAFQTMFDCLLEGNQRWADKASALVIVVVEKQAPDAEKPNAGAEFDAALAVGSLSVEATARALHIHQMGGINRDKIIETYAIPEGYHPRIGIAIGHVGDAESLPDDLKAKELAPRQRKSLDEIVFAGTWGKTAY